MPYATSLMSNLTKKNRKKPNQTKKTKNQKKQQKTTKNNKILKNKTKKLNSPPQKIAPKYREN